MQITLFELVDAYLLDARHENVPTRITAKAESQEEMWILEMSRELSSYTGHTKNIDVGHIYRFGLAIHETFSQGRRHLALFRHTLALGLGGTDLMIVKQ